MAKSVEEVLVDVLSAHGKSDEAHVALATEVCRLRSENSAILQMQAQVNGVRDEIVQTLREELAQERRRLDVAIEKGVTFGGRGISYWESFSNGRQLYGNHRKLLDDLAAGVAT